MRIRSFEPVGNGFSRVLILGSMPGKTSLRLNQYYGYKYNQFWRMIYDLFNETMDDRYEARCAFLLKHQIALWDVLQTCERIGSLDADIKSPEVNDFNAFFALYPHIEHVYFNGLMARKMFNRYVLKSLIKPIRLFNLPSTSPAYTLSYEKKLEQWRVIYTYLTSNN